MQLRKPSREPNTQWKILVCKLQHTNGCNPTKSLYFACTQRSKQQFVPVLDTLVGQIGDVPTSAVTRANLQQVPTGIAGVGHVVQSTEGMVICMEEEEFHGWNGCRFGSPHLFRHPPSPCLCALLTYGARGVGNRRSVRNVQRDEEASWNFRRI